MTIVYFGNTLNRHQVYVADALYELTGGQYTYVETVAPTDENRSGGKVRINRPFVLRAYERTSAYQQALFLARSCDVALFGANSFSFEIERMKDGTRLSFEVSERLLKRGALNLLSPSLLERIWFYHTRKWSDKPLYKLCASAYCANDQYALHTFKSKCYKWGYFTNVDEWDAGSIPQEDMQLKPISIMWCARFLNWKHPELPLYLAVRLKESGYSFFLDMYGSGALLESAKKISKVLHVDDVVRFMGDVPNDVILQAMHNHSIFLFTSDRREGWGAVLNEAMSNGCAVVASDQAGAVPFLVKDGENGCIFRSNDIDSLYKKVSKLIDNPIECRRIRMDAYRTIRDFWSPKVASRNLYLLCEQLLKGGNEDCINYGPCSKAYPIEC